MRRINKVLAPLCIGISLFLLCFLVLYRDNRGQKLKKARATYDQLRQEVSEQREKNRVLFDEIQHIKNDRFTLEKIAREQLQYSDPDDLIIKLNGHENAKDPASQPARK